MKADARVKMFLVKSCLIVVFTLTQRRALNFAFSVVTAAVWLIYADYYVAECAPDLRWLSGVYLAVPVILILLLSAVTAVQIMVRIRNGPRAEMFRAAPVLALPEIKQKQVWREMLSDLAMMHDGMAQRYILWIRSYFGSWWDRIRFVGWVPWYWLALMSILTIPGLRSRAMELVATCVTRVPPSPVCRVNYTGPRILGRIDGIDAYLMDSGVPYGPWSLDPDPETLTFVLNKPGNGTLALGEKFK